MSLRLVHPTYDIDIEAIERKRRGQYDLEDQFVWFYEIIRSCPDLGWRENRRGGKVTLSDNERRSIIKLDCPNIDILNQKQNFVRLFSLEPWTPAAIMIEIQESNGQLKPESRIRLQRFLDCRKDATLLFLKKGGPGIGGGFDVDPLIRSSKLEIDILKAIERQNENKRYARNVFILQEGIANPLLTPKGQKIDLRLYMMIVGDAFGNNAFYACRIGDVRNTAAFPYEHLSLDRDLQITNVAQNIDKIKDGETEKITRVFPDKDFPKESSEIIFNHFLGIVNRIGIIFSPFLIEKSRSPFVTLIGLDAVVDSMTMFPWIVEMNRRPTVYTPKKAQDMNYSSRLFMDDVFNIGILSIVDGNVGRREMLDEMFVLVKI